MLAANPMWGEIHLPCELQRTQMFKSHCVQRDCEDLPRVNPNKVLNVDVQCSLKSKRFEFETAGKRAVLPKSRRRQQKQLRKKIAVELQNLKECLPIRPKTLRLTLTTALEFIIELERSQLFYLEMIDNLNERKRQLEMSLCSSQTT